MELSSRVQSFYKLKYQLAFENWGIVLFSYELDKLLCCFQIALLCHTNNLYMLGKNYFICSFASNNIGRISYIMGR